MKRSEIQKCVQVLGIIKEYNQKGFKIDEVKLLGEEGDLTISIDIMNDKSEVIGLEINLK